MNERAERPCLVLRLAGPLQSWGSRSQFNRRETDAEPTKSGVVGLLAAAQGRRREDSIVDLVRLRLAVRVDQPGTLLHDYHTVSDHRGLPLLSAAVTTQGRQKATKYLTRPTRRYYLQDAVFIAVLEGERGLLAGMATAVANPGFPLALGRRACVPTQPILVQPPPDRTAGDGLWSGTLEDIVEAVPWQASERTRQRFERSKEAGPTVMLSVTKDDEDGNDVRNDVPLTFSHRDRAFTLRRISQKWIQVPSGVEGVGVGDSVEHDPFALMGW